MQQFEEFDNEGYDIRLVLYDIVQNSKARYNQCQEIHLLDLNSQSLPVL